MLIGFHEKKGAKQQKSKKSMLFSRSPQGALLTFFKGHRQSRPTRREREVVRRGSFDIYPLSIGPPLVVEPPPFLTTEKGGCDVRRAGTKGITFCPPSLRCCFQKSITDEKEERRRRGGGGAKLNSKWRTRSTPPSATYSCSFSSLVWYVPTHSPFLSCDSVCVGD